jgi:hypothetical protein
VGVTGYEIVTVRRLLSGPVIQLRVACPAGKQVLGGGAAVDPQYTMDASHPSDTGPGWYGAFRPKGAEVPNNFQVWAICANVD